MADDIKIWLPPLLTLLGTLIVVVFTAWLNNRAVLAEIRALGAELRLEMANLRLELKTEIHGVQVELVELRNRVDKLEVERRVVR